MTNTLAHALRDQALSLLPYHAAAVQYQDTNTQAFIIGLISDCITALMVQDALECLRLHKLLTKLFNDPTMAATALFKHKREKEARNHD